MKSEIYQINKERTKGAIVKSKANWAFLGEKGTKYFLKMEKRNFTNKTIYRLRAQDGRIVSGKEQVLDQIKKYYQKLYTSTGSILREYANELQVPKLPVELKEELDEPISQKEVSKALYTMASNKSPGCDGLPPEFYKVFLPQN